jgi:hypothetical protein
MGQLHLPYVVVAQLNQLILKLLKGDLSWQTTEVPGTEVTELEYQSMHWPYLARTLRLVFATHEVLLRALKRIEATI